MTRLAFFFLRRARLFLSLLNLNPIQWRPSQTLFFQVGRFCRSGQRLGQHVASVVRRRYRHMWTDISDSTVEIELLHQYCTSTILTSELPSKRAGAAPMPRFVLTVFKPISGVSPSSFVLDNHGASSASPSP